MARSLHDLERLFDVQVTGATCVAQDIDISEPVLIEGVRADRLELREVCIEGQFVLRDCFFDSVLLVNCLPTSVLFSNCHIARLAVRKLPLATNLAVTGGQYTSILLRGAGRIMATDTRCASAFTISGLRADVSVRRLSCGEFTVAEQLSTRSRPPQIEIEEMDARGSVRLRDLHVAALSLNQCHVSRHLFLQRLVVDGRVSVSRLQCSGSALLDGLTSAEPIQIADSILHGGLDARQLGRHKVGDLPVLIEIHRSELAKSVQLVADPPAGDVLFRDTTVTGQIHFPTVGIRYRVDAGTSIADIEVPSAPMYTFRQIRTFARDRFWEADAVSLAIVRRALLRRQRISESDICYYLQRNAESTRHRWIAMLFRRAVLGGIFGWGVRAWAPVRALIVGIALTALLLAAVGLPGGSPGSSATDALALSAALWLNVGTGAPQTLTTAGWSAVATLLTAGGLMLITTTIAMVIRRLTR